MHACVRVSPTGRKISLGDYDFNAIRARAREPRIGNDSMKRCSISFVELESKM